MSSSRCGLGHEALAGSGPPGAFVVGADGTFRPLPSKSALKELSGLDRPEKYRVTTVFASDGRHVHLRKPAEAESSKRSEPARSMRQAPQSEPIPSNSSEGSAALWSVQKSGSLEVRMIPPREASSEALETAAPSWLDTRLKQAQAQPSSQVALRGKRQRADSAEDPDAAKASVEVKVSTRSPSGFRQSSASLKITAPTVSALDQLIQKSIDGIVSEMRPALS
mmetsp:Transcript_4130/g.7578  ORF Transcript_4130/g.7578 Transcript_4130/m.7578 type:complete len:223 (+) Transcript_4130:70-738(+)